VLSFDRKGIKAKFMKMAYDCFSRYGFKKTTMDDIARAAGKAKSSLYYYFKSKEEIIEAIAANEIEAINSEIKNAVNNEADPKKKLAVYIITRFHSVFKTFNYHNILKADYLENYAFLEKMRAGYDKEQAKIIKSIMKYGIEQGVFSIKHLDLLVDTFVVALKGFEIECISEQDFPGLEKQVAILLDTLFFGILKR
jgi:AcrR family transcriptional regulator